MVTFNIFQPYVFILHSISFACSPINKARLEAERNSRLNGNSNEVIKNKNFQSSSSDHDDIPKKGHYLMWSLKHPIKTIQLIKRYHMVGNVPITLHLLSTLMLIHLLIKSIVFFQAGEDKQILDHYDRILYTNIGSLAKNPADFNTLAIGFVIFFLCSRLRNLYILIEQAIINSNNYEKLHVPQLNLAYMTTFNLTLRQWLDIWNCASEHSREIKMSSIKFKNHLKFDEKIHNELYKHFNKHTIFHYNLIDFEECYSGLNFLKNQNQRQLEHYRVWQTAYPINRHPLISLQYTILFLLLTSSASFLGLSISIIAVMYRDLAQPYPDEYSLYDLIGNIPKHWTNLFHIVRLIELSFLFSCQTPQIFESMKVAFDVTLTTLRAQKLIDIFRGHLKTCQSQIFKTKMMKVEKKLQSNESLLGRIKLQSKLKQKFNERLLDDVALTRLVHVELLKLKHSHTTFINMLVLGSSVCMSYTVSLVIRHNSEVELVILYLTFMSCSIPMIINLIACARVERTVSISSSN